MTVEEETTPEKLITIAFAAGMLTERMRDESLRLLELGRRVDLCSIPEIYPGREGDTVIVEDPEMKHGHLHASTFYRWLVDKR